MPNNVNKVIYGGRTLIDLTGDTVSPDKLLTGTTAHDKSGEIIEGTCPWDVNSTDATVSEAEILFGKTAYARGTKITGTMPKKPRRLRFHKGITMAAEKFPSIP